MTKAARSVQRARLACWVWDFAMLALAVLGLVLALSLSGCTQPTENGPAWPPTVAFDRAEVGGFLELDTPAGPARVDLGTGVIYGDAETGLAVRSWGIDVEASVAVNGSPQPLTVSADGHRADTGWVHCLDGSVGLWGVLARGRWPLSAECGPPVAEIVLQTFRDGPDDGALQ